MGHAAFGMLGTLNPVCKYIVQSLQILQLVSSILLGYFFSLRGFSQCDPILEIHEMMPGKNNDPSPSAVQQNHQILCCAFNANGTVFVTGSSDTYARV